MNTQNSNLPKLIEVLDLLNELIENYSIYIYLIDTRYHLLWYNNFVNKIFPIPTTEDKPSCCEALWKMDQPCQDCPRWDDSDARLAKRYTLKRKLPHSEEEHYLEIISLPVLTPSNEIEGFLKIAVDITPIEKKQLELRRKEKLFTSIIETSSDAIYMLDENEHIVSWNRGAEEIFGYSSDEIIGKSNIILIPQEMVELGEQFYLTNELATKGYIRRFETQRVHKNGHLIHVDLISNQLKDENDNIIGRSIMIKDITARKELEFELRRSVLELTKLNELNEILYTTNVLDEILKVMLIAVTAGEGLRFNRAFLFLKDKNKNSLRGHLVIGPGDHSRAHRLWVTLQKKMYSLGEIVEKYKAEQLGIDVDLNTLVRDIVVPVQNRHHLMIQCLEKRQTFHVINGRVEGRRRIDYKVNGKSLMEILGSNTFVLVPLATKQESLGVLLADNNITNRDISREDIESLKLFASQAGMAIENAKLYDSLEERIKELQEAYRKMESDADRLVKAERLAAVGEMAATVAHEIRNPLVSIGGFAQLLKKKLPDNEKIQRYANIIISQVENLENILGNILNIAHPKKPELQVFDIHKIIHQALMMMEEVIQERKIKLNLQWNCPDASVVGDEKLLFQAVLNIIKNALEAMQIDKILDIKTSCDDEFIEIHIKDQGRGIPAQHLEKIYDPFFSTKSGGTGLGLSVVRQIVHDHHGNIEIQSQVNRGTQVKIYIPRSKNNQKTS